ncbi:RNA polymerase sigma-70 factor (ECF subfamily) [Chitinophaga niastensis]|uniref:RNA polymerase sigma-70 factor (ECF subfamily) n=1 Tax=Chitinophaga niastensis TaxID=536980 RepID=A0A2P8HEQ7_CHINA|nr:sigma-70 family RNA polymerase sigma factor [Chitinophaga niastensis]PSL44707.1 RNA polymerase sigma-70 factor (ECF subfamily) [Chitinophaga niastensis]
MGLNCIDNEREILEQIASGSEQAFAKLFHGYVNQAGRLVYAIIGSREQTEEVLQDLFVKLWKDREKLTGIKAFNAYFFILLRNHTLNYLVSVVNEKKKQTEYARLALIPESLEDSQPDGRLDILDKAIDALPTQQKTVFLLRAQGYRNPEIATRMNLSTDSVKKYNQLALKFIHQFIKVRVTVLFTLAAIRFFK